MRRIGTFALLAGISLVAMGNGHGAQPQKPVTAPDFSAKGSDGKTHTLKSLTDGKTLVLYFISHTCPINADAVQYYKQIGEAYPGKVNFVGVIDGNEKVLKEWNKEHGVKFPVLYDPQHKIIKSYKAAASPWIIVVDSKGQAVKKHEGYSTKQLNELNALMAKAAGAKAAKIDTKGAPASEMFG